MKADELITELVRRRRIARDAITWKRWLEDRYARGMTGKTVAEEPEQMMQEDILQLKFVIIEIGRALPTLCDALDATAPRERIFDALNVNPADRVSTAVKKHGHKTLHLISALRLENSATKDDAIEIRPLNWCLTMAMLNAMGTNAKFDRAAHDAANEIFGGAFGAFQERPLTSRLTGA